MSVTLEFIPGESKTGAKGSVYSHWMAKAGAYYDGVGDTPLDAVMALAIQMYDERRQP